MNAQQNTKFSKLLFAINTSINSCCLCLDKTISKNKYKRDLHIRFTSIAITDSVIEETKEQMALLFII